MDISFYHYLNDLNFLANETLRLSLYTKIIRCFDIYGPWLDILGLLRMYTRNVGNKNGYARTGLKGLWYNISELDASVFMYTFSIDASRQL